MVSKSTFCRQACSSKHRSSSLKKRAAQRGLGVAELERIRLQELAAETQPPCSLRCRPCAFANNRHGLQPASIACPYCCHPKPVLASRPPALSQQLQLAPTMPSLQRLPSTSPPLFCSEGLPSPPTALHFSSLFLSNGRTRSQLLTPAPLPHFDVADAHSSTPIGFPVLCPSSPLQLAPSITSLRSPSPPVRAMRTASHSLAAEPGLLQLFYPSSFCLKPKNGHASDGKTAIKVDTNAVAVPHSFSFGEHSSTSVKQGVLLPGLRNSAELELPSFQTHSQDSNDVSWSNLLDLNVIEEENINIRSYNGSKKEWRANHNMSFSDDFLKLGLPTPIAINETQVDFNVQLSHPKNVEDSKYTKNKINCNQLIKDSALLDLDLELKLA